MRALITVLALLFTVTAHAQSPAELGPDVGTSIPFEFSLKDHTGTPQTLATLSGEKGVLLFYTRSLDWCPFCATQMIEVIEQAESFESMGYGVASVSYDSPAKLAQFANAQGERIALLSDENSSTIKALGILNDQVSESSSLYGFPHPIVFAVRPDGTIAAKFFEQDYRRRPPLDAIIADLEALDGAS